MGAIVTLEEIKQDCRIDNTFEDERLNTLIARAEELVLSYIGYDTVEDFYYEHGEVGDQQLHGAVSLVVQTMRNDPMAQTYLTKSVKDLVRRLRDISTRIG